MSEDNNEKERGLTPRSPTIRDVTRAMSTMNEDNAHMAGLGHVPPQVLMYCFEDCDEEYLWELSPEEYTALEAKARATNASFLSRWDARWVSITAPRQSNTE